VFPCVLCGLLFAEATIPDLGVFVFEEPIGLDYRMAPEWKPARLKALFECLYQIQKIAPGAHIGLPEALPTERALCDLPVRNPDQLGPIVRYPRLKAGGLSLARPPLHKAMAKAETIGRLEAARRTVKTIRQGTYHGY